LSGAKNVFQIIKEKMDTFLKMLMKISSFLFFEKGLNNTSHFFFPSFNFPQFSFLNIFFIPLSFCAQVDVEKKMFFKKRDRS
jgi:hypothetical protein